MSGESFWPKLFNVGSEGGTLDSANPALKYILDRTDPLFLRKGFSQSIEIDNNDFADFVEPKTIQASNGIIQAFKKKNATLLTQFRNETIRYSAWLKYRFKGEDFLLPKIGFLQYSNAWVDDESTVVTGSESTTAIDPGFSSKNRWVKGRTQILESTVNGAAFAYIQANNFIEEAELVIDNYVAEHAIGTEQACRGFFTFPICPAQGRLRINVDRLPRRIAKNSGDTSSLFVKNAVSLYTIEATFERVDIGFINDMKVFQEYSDNDQILCLRTFLFDTIPPVLFCRMKMDDPQLRNERGLNMYDLTINFEETLV